MSEYETPLGPIFKLQRETLKRSADVLQLPRTLRNELYEDGVTAGDHLVRQAIEASRTSVHQSLRVAETVQYSGSQMELDALHGTADEIFESLLDSQEAIAEHLDERYERTDTEALTRSAEQLNLLLELNERVETQLVTAFEKLEQQATRSDELADEVEQQLETLSEQIERQGERLAK